MTSRRNKDVYERIKDMRNKIAATEEELVQLRSNLKTLEAERDSLEMHQLFNLIRNNGITFEEAKSILIKK